MLTNQRSYTINLIDLNQELSKNAKKLKLGKSKELLFYRVDVLSVVVEVVRPPQLVVHGVDGAGLDGAGHVAGLGEVAGAGASAHHVAPGEARREVCLLLLPLPASTIEQVY